MEDYDGRISLLAQGWRKKTMPEVQPEKEKVSTGGAVVRPIKTIPAAPIVIPEIKIQATRPEVDTKACGSKA